MVKSHMAQTLKAATTFIEQGRILLYRRFYLSTTKMHHLNCRKVTQYTYCKRIIFSVYDIWQNFNFWLFSVDLNWRFILINLIIPK